MFAPVVSPDGRHVALTWTRHPARGIWTIDAATGTGALLHASSAAALVPIGWSADGRFVYVVEGKSGSFRGPTSFIGESMTRVKILRLAAEGGVAQALVSIPHDEIGSVSMTPDARRFVYPVFSSRSDVWVVDDFDSSSARSRALSVSDAAWRNSARASSSRPSLASSSPRTLGSR